MTKEGREAAELNLRSFAKVNLSLDVTGVREDGYHTVETVMQQVSLHDEINIRWEPHQGQEFQCRFPIEQSHNSSLHQGR